MTYNNFIVAANNSIMVFLTGVPFKVQMCIMYGVEQQFPYL